MWSQNNPTDFFCLQAVARLGMLSPSQVPIEEMVGSLKREIHSYL
jgi:hypothetical protein